MLGFLFCTGLLFMPWAAPEAQESAPLALPLPAVAESPCRPEKRNMLTRGPVAMVNAAAADVNGDGKSDWADVKFISSRFTPTPATAEQRRLDVNQDGKVDAVDAALVQSVAYSVYALAEQQAKLDSGELRPAPYFDFVNVSVTVDGTRQTFPLDEMTLRELPPETVEAVHAARNAGRAVPRDREALLAGLFREEGNFFVITTEQPDPQTGQERTYRWQMQMSDYRLVRGRDGTSRRVYRDTELLMTTYTDDDENTHHLTTSAELYRHGRITRRFVWGILTGVKFDGERLDVEMVDMSDLGALGRLQAAAEERGAPTVEPASVTGLTGSPACPKPDTSTQEENSGPVVVGEPGVCKWQPDEWPPFDPPFCDPAEIRYELGNVTIILRENYGYGKVLGPFKYGCDLAPRTVTYASEEIRGFRTNRHVDLQVKIEEAWGFGMSSDWSWERNIKTSHSITFNFGPLPGKQYREAIGFIDHSYTATRIDRGWVWDDTFTNTVVTKGVGFDSSVRVCYCCPPLFCHDEATGPPPGGASGDPGSPQ